MVGARVSRQESTLFCVQVIQGFKRQALHAERLSFEHPRSREMVSFTAPLADDFQHLLDALIQYD